MSKTQAAHAGAILREFLAFLRRPRLLVPTGLRAPGALAQLAVLILLDLAVLLILLLPLIASWQQFFSLPTPDAFDKISPAMLVPVAVLIAPVVEEMLFRGWLTGRARALWLLACAIGCAALVFASTQGMDPAAAGFGLIGFAIAAIAGWLALRKRPASRWFAQAFAPIFYLSALVFSLVHMLNYPSFSALALPLVLPQLWSGLLLGFARMRLGLAASMLVHGTANGTVLAVAALANGPGA